MGVPEIRVLGSADEVAAAAADLLVEAGRAGGHVALAGGSTPKKAYRLAAEQLEDWSAAPLWLGDERLVAPDDERYNYRMIREQGLEPERVLTEEGLQGAAGDYEARLRAALGHDPRLDLAIMGLGPDGHAASLFPGKPALQEERHLVAAVPEAGMEPQVPRLTMTFPVFNATRLVVFLVAGADKAQAMARAFGPAPDSSAPSALV